MGCHHFAECPVCDAPDPCAHCEDGWSEAGHCTCCEPEGLIVVDREWGVVSAEVWRRHKCTSRESFCTPLDASTIDGLVAVARVELERYGCRRVKVTWDLEAVA